MENKIPFEVREGFCLTVTVESKYVKELRAASEKYQVTITDAEYLLVSKDGSVNCYYQLSGYGLVEHAFGVPAGQLQGGDGLQANALELLQRNLDNMDWGRILDAYLGEMGIEYNISDSIREIEEPEDDTGVVNMFYPDAKPDAE